MLCLHFQGLHYLHGKKILHRDLKAANVFLMKDQDRDRNSFLVKIGDLGVAKLLDTSTAFAQTIVGTPYYLNPELCADQPYRDKSDCWALGVLLYEVRSSTMLSVQIHYCSSIKFCLAKL